MGSVDILYCIIIVALILLYYLIILTDMRRKVVTYTYTILFVGCLVFLAGVMYYHRKETENSLLQIYAVAVKANNMESALADSSRYEAILLDINKNEERLQSILHRVSFTDRLLGRSIEVDSLADQTSKMLQMQKLRIYNLNNKSINLYQPTVFKDASTELRMLGSDDLNRDYINSGFKVDHSAMFIENNVVLVRIIETKKDSILYQQFYVPKDSINSFVLPNVFKDDNVELQMGYINKSDTTTFHYIKSIPYGK